jgi:hypothetical protein
MNLGSLLRTRLQRAGIIQQIEPVGAPAQEPGRCVVQDWVFGCSFKMQTVMLSALRGCDGKGKEDPSKHLVRQLRSVILHNASPGDGKFMQVGDFQKCLDAVTEDLDHYPVHWVTHFMHACEIIGYMHRDGRVRAQWQNAYRQFVDALHLMPETEFELSARLMDGPVSPVRKFTPVVYSEPTCSGGYAG